MASQLAKHPFTAADWADVQNFDCGDEPFEQEVADWLMGPAEEGVESALNSIADERRESRVWLYKLGDQLVGFGALAKTEWRWPGKNKDPKLPLSIIIWVGIQKEFRGQPPGPREGRYAAQILDDLVAEAEADAWTHPVLGLFVHKDNKRAIKFYKDAGFSDELVQRVDKTTGEVEYYKMFIVLDDEALQDVVKEATR
ncbi:MAG TPA: GNAT family N-acetyltransferase [Gemmataceae bacterium]|jgi:ribosomal protein S18 acetylase RimI-like enzyme|nr:GNAT family N-acetyltransferase [Gemmataceae bacterium]